MLNEQFTTYDKDIKTYKKHVSNVVDNREESRNTLSKKDPENQTKAQKE